MCAGYALPEKYAEVDWTEGWYPMVLEMDNRGAIDLINSCSVGGRKRHIDVKQCFLRELKEAKILVVKWIPGSVNEADIFTKNIDGPIFKRYADLLLGKGSDLTNRSN